jgi:aspartate/glutamate racemase
MTDLSNKTLGIIHAALISTKSVDPFIKEIIPEVTVVHHVDDTIQNLNFVQQPGYIPKVNLYKFVTYAHYLQEAKVDLILLACSTFNIAVEFARPLIEIPLLQIDRPMMDLAVKDGRRIGLIGTVPSTMIPSENLLRKAADDAGKNIEVKTVLCSKAFEEIKLGNVEKHNSILLDEINVLSKSVDAIVLAQVSMSALEPMLTGFNVPIYNSGRTGFNKVRQILEGNE